MTDLSRILPSFPIHGFAGLMPTIEQHALTTTDLLTLDPTDLAKQTHLPILDLRRFLAAIHASLSHDLSNKKTLIPLNDATPTPTAPVISTLDAHLDAALGGGIPAGCITEFAGESGAGKTQFLLSLCLAVQLPPPHGLGKKALYISTESGLATRRLAQMLASNPLLQTGAASLDGILSTVTPDLESQDHILEYQVPVLLAAHSVGLLVIDSVAANYRAEFERRGSMGSNMAARSAELIRLGALLRDVAVRHNLAVVVANQVADRFQSTAAVPHHHHHHHHHHRNSPQRIFAPPGRRAQKSESPLAHRSAPLPSSIPSSAAAANDESPWPALLLDHQQRWFTGWGDDPQAAHSLKTPSLGLVWSTQIACRIALFKLPVYARPHSTDHATDSTVSSSLGTWRRWLKVVFAPHVRASGQGTRDAVEFEITMAGLKSVTKDT